MKCSKYNFIISINKENFAIYNSKTNALAIIDENELNISSIKVTIDEDKNSHDLKRILINGKDTYDKILKNLRDNIDILPLILY